MNCSLYNITSASSFGIASNLDDYVNNKQNCQNFSSFSSINIDSNCSLANIINQEIIGSCSNSTICNTTIDTTNLMNNCKTTQNQFTNDFFLSYTCYNSVLSFAGKQYTRPSWGYVVVIIDIVSMIIFYTTIITFYFLKV